MNIGRMKKNEIVWMANHRCLKHHMPYIEHPSCYEREMPETTNIGFIDIETTDFKADWGIMLCFAICDEWGEMEHALIDPIDMRDPKVLDKKVVKACVDAITQYDILVGYYHSRFDLKFIRTRAVALKIPFPEYDAIKQRDVYYMIRNRFLLTSNRLENACKTLLGKSNKTKMDRNVWRSAILTGDQKSLDYILDHCIKDVQDTKKLYEKVVNFTKRMDRSI